MKTRTEKRCPRCGEVKPIGEFYYNTSVKRYASYCCECACQLSKNNYDDDKVMKYPNQYSTKKQMRETYEMMENLGWIFIKDNYNKGMWIKPGVKNMDGTFVKTINKKNNREV